MSSSNNPNTSNKKKKSIFTPPSLTRLVTIVAQVDHGKTTLADSLIASNGIISERLAGTLRYLDSLEEEQRRGITMRTSAIALQHQYQEPKKKKKKGSSSEEKMVIHLLDSPGHMDFSCEVSSALQISDGALLVVDAVEGLCARTHQVLREAFVHEMVPILIINKIDRLCTELALTPTEAYVRLKRLLESINAASAAMMMANDISKEEKKKEEGNNNNTTNNNNNNNSDHWIFDASRGNVVFASALMGWGFTVPSLARQLYRSKMITDLKPIQLKQCLFGDFKYYDHTNDGKVWKWNEAKDEDELPMFAKYGLEPIWNLHHVIMDSIVCSDDSTGNTNNFKYLETLLVNEHGWDKDTVESQLTEVIRRHCKNPKKKSSISEAEGEVLLRSLLRMVRPLSQTVLDAVCEICPSPQDASSKLRTRALALQEQQQEYKDDTTEIVIDDNNRQQQHHHLVVRRAVQDCCVVDENDDGKVPMVAHICKFFSIDPSHILNRGTAENNTNSSSNSSNILMGVTRVLSGTLESGQSYYCYGPKYNSSSSPPNSGKIQLYLIMGNHSLLPVSEVPAGHVCALGGLWDNNNNNEKNGDFMYSKTLTLSSSEYAMPLRGFDFGRRPLVKVNVECYEHQEALEKSLMQLTLADAAVEVTATSKGERLLACLGEIHLEQCWHDLQSLMKLNIKKLQQEEEQGKSGNGNDIIHHMNENKNDNDDDGILLRQSRPIVEFGETTAWITTTNNNNNDTNTSTEKEDTINDEATKDYSTFFTIGRKRQPLHHTTLPPYNEEEGIQWANSGRARALLSGKTAALHVRAIPLEPSIYRAIINKKNKDHNNDNPDDDDNKDDDDPLNHEELIQLTRALGCPAVEDGVECSSKEQQQDIMLSYLLDTLVANDANGGNILLESQSVKSGYAVKGIPRDQVYVPLTSSNNNNKSNNKYSATKEKEEEEANDYHDDEKKEEERTQQEEAEQIFERIRNGGLILTKEQKEKISSSNFSSLDQMAFDVYQNEISGSLSAGFQLGVRAGPFCEEPIHRIAVILEAVEIAIPSKQKDSSSSSSIMLLSSGMVVAALQRGIRCALLSRPARLVESCFRMTLHSSLEGLAGLYSVLNQRHGRVLEDDMVDGTNLLKITAVVPQAESLGLGPELLNKTRGEVTVPEWEKYHQFVLLPQDPFWVPTSLDEREDYGDYTYNDNDQKSNANADGGGANNNASNENNNNNNSNNIRSNNSAHNANRALLYIREVRARKGLLVDSTKTVLAAEKQRTIKR